jgi:hypothetical protein
MAQDNRRDDPLQDQAAGWRLVLPSGADWMDDEQWAVYLAADPVDPRLSPDPDGPPEFSRAELAAIISECRQIGEDEARAAALAARMGTTGALAAIGAALGRRGPGQPGSAEQFPGEYPGPAGAFATGMILDAAPGGMELGLFAADAAGTGDRYAGASDDALVGAICAWDRVEAHAAARKYAAVAELIRRRPAAGCPLEGEAQMPAGWDEFTGDELSWPWPSPRAARPACSTWPGTWRSNCPARRPRSSAGPCGSARPGSSPTPPGRWTPARPAPPRRSCWTGPGG